MTLNALAARRVTPRVELCAIIAVAWLAFISVPLWFGKMGLSWDALNHHIYLGWIADHPRFDRDFLAAGYQSFTFPYLYWPVYKLASSGAGPVATGIVLATLHLLTVPPVWMIARVCIPGPSFADTAMRAMAVVLAFMSGVILSQMDSSSNDLLAAIPLVWGIAMAVQALDPHAAGNRRALTLGSGLLAGMAVGCKLSNGPIAVLLPVLWLFAGSTPRERLANTFMACLATVAGAIITYGYWGIQLWVHFGNPLYPFYDTAFAPLREFLGWSPPW